MGLIPSYLHGVNRTKNMTVEGRLNLVDLAGSERLDKSHSTGEAMEEAKFINRSLSALSSVFPQHPDEQPRQLPRQQTDAVVKGLSIEGGEDAHVCKPEPHRRVSAGEPLLSQLCFHCQSVQANASQKEGESLITCVLRNTRITGRIDEPNPQQPP